MKNQSISRRLTDGLHSMLTSLGERVTAIKYSGGRSDMTDIELLAMYKKSWVVKKYIDKTADDMLKKIREFSGSIDDQLQKNIVNMERELNVYQVYHDALTWASLLGDSLIVAITDCQNNLIDKPLSLQNEDIVKFIVLSKGEYYPSNNLIADIASTHFGSPNYYHINIGSRQLKFHHTRCHRTKLGKHRLKDITEFGASDIQSAYEAIKIFDTAVLSSGDTIQEANVDVIFLPGLNNQISSGKEEHIIEYARVVKETKSATGMLLIDAGDSSQPGRYEQKNAQFSGLSEVVTKMANVLAGALDRPITVLFGQSASGFSSGEEDNKSYYETINGLQESRLRPMQDFVDQFILDKLAADGKSITYTYPSIDSINEVDEASRFSQYAAGFTSLVTASIVSETIALRELVARGVLTTVTDDDRQLLEGVSNEQWSFESAADSGAKSA